MNKKMLNYLYGFPIFILVILLLSCQKKLESGTSNEGSANELELGGRPLVVTTIAPYKFLLQELAGDYIRILNTSEHSKDPHNVDLTPQQALQLKTANIFLSLNPNEESLLRKSLGKQTKIVEMWHGFPLLAPTHDEHENEGEGDTEEETASWDEHFWLSPAVLAVQIETMAGELSLLIPDQKQVVESNKETLLQRCNDLKQQLLSRLPQLQNGKLLNFHSSLSYFAEFFNAEEIHIESQGIELGSDEVLHLFEATKELTFPVLIYSPQFEQEKAKALAKQLKLGMLEFDPQKPDVFENLLDFAEQLGNTKN